ncbi:MAG: hypothetical protein LBT91_03830 [Bifidobacteriaceae bacterium]|jgi:hypothetical protein|nr:hypothetical protein [Bifidobacteriaceae bacterium]
MKIKNSYDINLSGITNIRRSKGRPKGSTKFETSYGARNLTKILHILRNYERYRPIVEPSDSDLEYERQRKISASVPYLRLEKDKLAKLASIHGAAASFGIGYPSKLEGFCVDGYYEQLVDLFHNAKGYVNNNCDVKDIGDNLDQYKISLKSCQVIDFDKIKSFGMGLVAINRSYHVVCTTMDLQRFCWRIRKIEIVPNSHNQAKNIYENASKKGQICNLNKISNNIVVRI